MKTFSDTMSKKAYRKKNRKQFECPSKLKELLIRMAWLDFPISQMPFSDGFKLAKGQMPFADELELSKRGLDLCLEGAPEELHNYVKNGEPLLPNNDYQFHDVGYLDVYREVQNQILRYEDYRISRLKLSRLVLLKERYGKKHSASVISEDFERTGILQVDEQGKIQVVNDSFGEAVNGVLIDRIRNCRICKQIFWAVNKNSRACSPSHAANLRNRESRLNLKEKRGNEKDKLNEQRRLTYRRKKELEKGKKKREERNSNL